MSSKITWKVDIGVEKGPSFTLNQSVDVEAYDHLRVEVPGGDSTTPGTVTAEVQPGAANQLRFLSVISSVYSDTLTVKPGGGPDVRLTTPLVFMGGALALLGSDPKQFTITNTGGADKPAVVQILVGRKATS